MRRLLCIFILIASAYGREAAKTEAVQPAAPASEPAKPAAASSETRSDLNLLGKTNTDSGESRRNENVQFNLIDNNAVKELNIRLGTTATLVQEFQPQRNYFGTEFGNAPVGQIHLATPPRAQKQFHGNLFASHNNSVFSARSFFQVGSVQPARENNEGVTFGGRAWKNAWFTVEGSQQKVRGVVNGNVLIPTEAERTPLATDPAVRQIVERWFAAFPLAAPNRTDVNERALNTNAGQSIDTNMARVRIDQILGGRDRLAFRHAWTSQTVDAFQFVSGQNPDVGTRSHTGRLTWHRAWRPQTLGEFSFGFDRVHSLLTAEPNAVGPQVQIGTVYTTLGPGSSIPIDRVQNRIRQAAMISHQSGTRRWVFGGELSRLQFNGREASSNRGNWYFRNDFGRDAISNFRMGIPSRYSTGIGEMGRGFRNWEQHYFAGGEWQARANLKLQYGVRYQPMRGPVEVNGRTRVPFECDCNNWSPRVGLAYRLPGRMGVVRTAGAVHYGEIFAATLQQLRWNPPDFLKIEVQGPDLLYPLRGIQVSAGTRTTLFDVPSALKTPYSYHYNASWEASLGLNWKLQAGYVGTRSHKLFMMWHENRAVPVPGIAQTTDTINLRRPDSRYFDYRRVVNGSRAYYDAARVTLIRPLLRGLSLDTSYWFSKSIDTGSAYTNMAAGDDAQQGFSQSPFLVQQDLRGPSAFDQSHSLLVRVTEELPAVRNRHRILALAGRWRLSAVWLAKTGLPFTVISGSDGAGFGNVDGTSGDRPHLVDTTVLGRSLGDPDASFGLLPRAAFRYMLPAESRGSLGSNTFRRGGIRNLNASVGRAWGLAGDRSLQFRAEAVNLTNTPQFAPPNFDLTNPAFGRITNTLNDGRTFQFILQLRF